MRGCSCPSARMNPTAPTGRILVIDAHPVEGSFCSFLASRFAEGARQAGHCVRLTRLRDLQFDYNARRQTLEADLLASQEDLRWCLHLVIVYPNWWGTYPALLKAFFDRILLPGFAFEAGQTGGWRGLLSGRSAQIITTMDTPLWVYRWILGAPGVRAVQRATLGFCGFKRIRVKLLGPIHSSTLSSRRAWLEEVFQMGLTASRQFQGSRHPELNAWLAVARLQFYPFPLLALVTGALAAAGAKGSSLHLTSLLLAGGCAFLVELMTVLTNEIEDQDTDRRNKNAGVFTGGSRVLIEGRLSEIQLRSARKAAAALLALMTALLVLRVGVGAGPLAGLVLAGLILGHQYSAKPLRLSYHGIGEVTVAFTHSFLVVGLGWASQGGNPAMAGPWGISLAIFTAVLPSILLAGFPDLEADQASGKHTLAGQWGRLATVRAAIIATLLAMVLKITTSSAGPLSVWFNTGALLHGLALAGALWRHAHPPRPGKIDGLLLLALTFMLWFALEPFCALWASSAGWRW